MNAITTRSVLIVACVLLGVLALSFRLFYLFDGQPEIPIRADAGQYFRIAINVVDHGVYSDAVPGDATPPPDSYRGPGFPTLIAVPWFLSRDVETTYWFVLLLQSVLGACTTILVFLLATRWMPLGFALASGVLVALWPHLIVQDGCLLTESVFGFLLVAAVYLTFHALISDRLVFGILCGIACAIAALVNSVIVPFPLFLFAMILPARGLRYALFFLFLALTPPLLWGLRDASIESPGTRSAGGRLFENVLIGMEPDFKPSYRDSHDPEAQAARDRVGEGSALYYRDKTKAYRTVLTRITEQPAQYVWWLLRKPALLWRWDVAQGAGDIYIYPMRSSPFEGNVAYRTVAALAAGLNRPLMLAAFGSAFLFVLAALGGRMRKQHRAYALCAAIFLYAVIVYTILTPDARYANPFRAFEIILAMSLTADIFQYVSKLRTNARDREASVGAGQIATARVEQQGE